MVFIYSWPATRKITLLQGLCRGWWVEKNEMNLVLRMLSTMILRNTFGDLRVVVVMHPIIHPPIHPSFRYSFSTYPSTHHLPSIHPFIIHHCSSTPHPSIINHPSSHPLFILKLMIHLFIHLSIDPPIFYLSIIHSSSIHSSTLYSSIHPSIHWL